MHDQKGLHCISPVLVLGRPPSQWGGIWGLRRSFEDGSSGTAPPGTEICQALQLACFAYALLPSTPGLQLAYDSAGNVPEGLLPCADDRDNHEDVLQPCAQEHVQSCSVHTLSMIRFMTQSPACAEDAEDEEDVELLPDPTPEAEVYADPQKVRERFLAGRNLSESRFPLGPVGGPGAFEKD